MADCPSSDIRFCNVFYFDCGKYSCMLVFLFESGVRGKGVHNSCQHADIIADSTLQAMFGSRCSAENVASADNYCNLGTALGGFDNFTGKPLGKFGVYAVLSPSKKRFAGKFEKYALILGHLAYFNRLALSLSNTCSFFWRWVFSSC